MILKQRKDNNMSNTIRVLIIYVLMVVGIILAIGFSLLEAEGKTIHYSYPCCGVTSKPAILKANEPIIPIIIDGEKLWFRCSEVKHNLAPETKGCP